MRQTPESSRSSASDADADVHQFRLIIDGDVNDDDTANALHEAGCSDALFGEQNGVTFGDFDREATSFTEALMSAAQAVESVDGLTVTGVEPSDD